MGCSVNLVVALAVARRLVQLQVLRRAPPQARRLVPPVALRQVRAKGCLPD